MVWFVVVFCFVLFCLLCSARWFVLFVLYSVVWLCFHGVLCVLVCVILVIVCSLCDV